MPKAQYVRIDVAGITPLTAPPYGTITFHERNGANVLVGQNLLLLIGPLGVNYYVESSDADVIYLRRFDMRPGRTADGKSSSILEQLRDRRATRH